YFHVRHPARNHQLLSCPRSAGSQRCSGLHPLDAMVVAAGRSRVFVDMHSVLGRWRQTLHIDGKLIEFLVFPSFEEGTSRRSNEVTLPLKSARRGRSDSLATLV